MMQDQTTRLMEVVSDRHVRLFQQVQIRFHTPVLDFSSVFQQLKWTFPTCSNTQVSLFQRGQEKRKTPKKNYFLLKQVFN
jgi:hypothetical protein